jgi:hypothetical protein
MMVAFLERRTLIRNVNARIILKCPIDRHNERCDKDTGDDTFDEMHLRELTILCCLNWMG